MIPIRSRGGSYPFHHTRTGRNWYRCCRCDKIDFTLYPDTVVVCQPSLQCERQPGSSFCRVCPQHRGHRGPLLYTRSVNRDDCRVKTVENSRPANGENALKLSCQFRAFRVRARYFVRPKRYRPYTPLVNSDRLRTVRMHRAYITGELRARLTRRIRKLSFRTATANGFVQKTIPVGRLMLFFRYHWNPPFCNAQ